MLKREKGYRDFSHFYKNEKDLNAFLIAACQQNKKQENSPRMKR